MATPPTRWIVGIAAVVFDIDVGQRIDYVAPENSLTEEEAHQVAFHSFPDSMSMELHAKTSVRDTCFWFRVKRDQAGAGNGTSVGAHEQKAYLYGYVFCRQRQDESLRRGGEQMSVVVLSEHPWSSVLRPLSQVAGPLFFTHGRAALHQVCQEVALWPAPTAAATLQLQISFNTLPGRLPPFETLPHPSCATAVDAGPPIPRSSSSLLRSGSHVEAAAGLTRQGSTAMSLGKLGSGSVAEASLDQEAAASLLDTLSFGVSNSRTASQPASLGGTLQTPAQDNNMTSLESLAAAQAGPRIGPGLPPLPGSSGNVKQTAATPTQIAMPVQSNTTCSSAASSASQVAELSKEVLATRTSVDSNSAFPISQGAGSARQSLSRMSAMSNGSAGSLEQLAHTLQRTTISQGHIQGVQPTILHIPPPPGTLQHSHTHSSSHLSLDGASAPQPSHQQQSTALAPSPQQQLLQSQSPGGVSVLRASSGSLAAAAQPLPGLPSTASFTASPSHGSFMLSPSGSGMPRRMSVGLTEGNAMVAGAFSDADIFTPLQPHLNKLWQLWEMVLLAKPLLVVAPSPADCSGAVAALVSLTAPLPYAPDFRPYYTIHDPSFTAMSSGALPGPQQQSVPCLLGITNLYFIKALPQWPSILSVGRKEQGSSWAAADTPGGGGMISSMFSAAGAVKAMRLRAQGAQALLSGHVENLWSGYKPVCRPDQTLLVRLLQPKPGDARSKLARIAAVNSDALRKHFLELTNAFLAPFSRYFEPGPDGFIPSWDDSEFLFSIRAQATPTPPILLDRVGNMGNLVELYARFVASTNFRDWFVLHRRKLQHLEAPVLPPHLQSSTQSSQQQEGSKASKWFMNARQYMDEVQLFNLVCELEGQLREAIVECEANGGEAEDQQRVYRLQRELVKLFLGIDQEDLQLVFASAPARRDLLIRAGQEVLRTDDFETVKQLCDKLK